MTDFDKLFSQSNVIDLNEYTRLTKYFEDSFNKNGLYVTTEQESQTSVRFDFEDDTSVWVNSAAIEGTLDKKNKKTVEKIIKNTPIKTTNYVRFM